ncbi:MAG: hypothetical protein IT356_09325 [Gemmatimonadaceae bacterium]|nr:hypothetical protein [Gemmatimonadaceae bacterium]
MIPIAGMVMIIVIVIGIPLVRSYTRRMERRDELAPRARDMDARLERIERTIDAMAVEVERVSEGQRFVTRLLAEHRPDPASLPPGAPPQA